MLDLAVIDDGDRLEPAMRMLADAAPLGCRREIMRPRIVEQQEGADVPIQRVIGKERADRETIAHPMRSEEHTSELQSLMRISYAVFCLKKKHNQKHELKYNNTDT